MGTKLLGNNYQIWVNTTVGGGAPVFVQIGGQGTAKRNMTRATIDTSDKNSYPYKTSSPGSIALSLDVAIKVALPDVGFTFLEQAVLNGTPVQVQIRRGGAAGISPADVNLDGLFYATDCSTTMNLDGVVDASIKLELASPPTTNSTI